MEYDFTVIYKLSKTHVVDVLSRLPNTIEHSKVLKQTINASIFYTKPKWLNDVKMFLQTQQMQESLSTRQKQWLAKGLNHLQ
jgi:hypothetical protein